jgi:hypothetical protein
VAYQVEIDDGLEEPLCDAFGHQAIRFALGYDLVSQTQVFMKVILGKKEDGIYDLRFGIEEYYFGKEDWTVGLDYSVEISKQYVPRSYRLQVLLLIVACVERLVRATRPRKITMQSFYPNLPDKALTKCESICEAICTDGYEFTKFFPYGTKGVHYWLFEPVAGTG